MTNYIWITAQKEFIHKYSIAPNGVEFLKNEHRHIFKFKISIEVFHNDRDIEFILFKRYVEEYLNTLPLNLGVMSCEMFADKLHEKISKTYLNRKMKISVSEDGENGGEYEYDKS